MMKNKTVLLKLFFIGALIMLVLRDIHNRYSNNLIVKIWHPLTLTLDGPETNELATPNPFTDFRADAIFISPSNKRYRVPAFYAADGNSAYTHASSGNKWQVKFSPNEIGQWQYQLSFVKGLNIASTPYKSDHHESSAGYFDQQTGTFKVINNDQKLDPKDFRTKGKLEYVNKPYLQFSGNKEYFLKSGANSPEVLLGFSGFDNTPTERTYLEHKKHWQEGDPLWQAANQESTSDTPNASKGIIGVINYLSSLDVNAFYFLTMNTFGDGKQVWPWLKEDKITRYDISKLAQWDIVFSHMQQKGIMAHFVLSETENESLFEWLDGKFSKDFSDSRKIYYRELFARFGYHLATTWNIGEENGWQDPSGNDKQQKANTTKQRKDFASYFQSLTYYNEHVVIHNGPSLDYHIFDDDNYSLLNHPAYTGPSLQGELKSKNIYDDVLKYRQLTETSPHPWVVSMDEAYIYEAASDIDLWRKENVWATFMAGGAGIEFYLGGGGDLFAQDLTIYKDFYLQMSHAVTFFKQYVPFESLFPVPQLSKTGWVLTDKSNYFLIYFKQSNTPSATLPPACYSLDWFNPREDLYLLGSKFCVISENESPLLLPPFEHEEDWVYIIKKVEEL